jgi:hypothetical protein
MGDAWERDVRARSSHRQVSGVGNAAYGYYDYNGNWTERHAPSSFLGKLRPQVYDKFYDKNDEPIYEIW